MACLKPDSDTELVIPYDCEDKFCSFNVSEFENSVVKLISITRIDTLGRRVRQRVTIINENNSWDKQRIIKCQNFNSFSNFIANTFDNDEHDENDFSLTAYEV